LYFLKNHTFFTMTYKLQIYKPPEILTRDGMTHQKSKLFLNVLREVLGQTWRGSGLKPFFCSRLTLFTGWFNMRSENFPEITNYKSWNYNNSGMQEEKVTSFSKTISLRYNPLDRSTEVNLWHKNFCLFRGQQLHR
jgi:hypothetical protein